MKRTVLVASETDLIPRPEVARSFGVVPRTVKRWEKIHGLTPHKVTSRLVAYPALQIAKLRAQSCTVAA